MKRDEEGMPKVIINTCMAREIKTRMGMGMELTGIWCFGHFLLAVSEEEELKSRRHVVFSWDPHLDDVVRGRLISVGSVV